MKPILFNTDMARAIREGRKTVTRRVIKYSCPSKPGNTLDDFIGTGDPQLLVGCSPYQAGDILWVRETWCEYIADHIIDGVRYAYKADATPNSEYARRELGYKWRPSIHMPKEAARLFLRIKAVRVERLRDMCLADVLMEGIREADSYEGTWDRWHETWNRTIKPSDLPCYGWEANPWVWVIGFERISKEAAQQEEGQDGKENP